jgi:putative ABC transport system permease protein
MGTLSQDFRYGLRMLRKQPGFTAVAVMTLALAIGANTAIFSIVYPVLLRPLPFANPDQLVTVGESRQKIDCCSYSTSYPNYLDWKANAKSFQSLAGYGGDAYTITGHGEPKTVFAAMVTTNFFSTLGVTPVLGRGFLPGEDLPSGQGPNVALLTYDFWRSDFGGDSKIIGRAVRLDGRPVTIVGILPRNFELTPAGILPIWVPLHLNNYERTARDAHWFSVIGRLAPGVKLEQARSEMTAIGSQLSRQYPATNAGVHVTVGSLSQHIVGDIRPLLLVLFCAVGFVLLIACANLANLMLSRSVDRRREFAVRAALGASQWHLILQLMIESLTLSLMGAVIGFVGAVIGIWVMAASVSEVQLDFMPYLRDVNISLPVLAFVAGITIVTALLFGLSPALSIRRLPISEVLKDESRGGTSASHSRLRNALVIAEIAISLVLLVSGGLMLQSLRLLLRQNPGFDPEHVLTFMVTLPSGPYPVSKTWPFTNPNGLRFTHEFMDRLKNLPGVVGVSATSALPVSQNLQGYRFVIEGRAVNPGEEENTVGRIVDDGYFSVMRIPVLRGRTFTSADGANASPVVMVNQAWTKRFFPNEDPVGKRIRFTLAPEEPYREIIGVVGDIAEDSLDAPAPPTTYMPVDQESGYTTFLNYVIRTSGDPAALLPSAHAVARSIDPELAFVQPQSLEDFLNRTPAVFLRRYPFYLIGSFAALALVLALLGLYGLISYSVAQRTREIGIRMALGAQREDILALTIRQGIVAATWGVAIGLVIALVATRVMTSILYGVGAADWLTFISVAFLLFVVAVAASYIPARRATQVDPMIALRNQ